MHKLAQQEAVVTEFRNGGNGTGTSEPVDNEADKVEVTSTVTTDAQKENGGSDGARTRNLCRDRAAL
jgi:hypothetical protein